MKQGRKLIYTYYQYASIGSQMVAVMAVAMWGGIKLDRYWQLRTPICLSTFAVLSTILCIYVTIRKLIHQNKQQDDDQASTT
jgi:hypothetical protein